MHTELTSGGADVSQRMENTLAKQARAEILQEHRGSFLPEHHAVTQHVKGVVRRIVLAGGLGHLAGEAPPPDARGGGIDDGLFHEDERLRVDVASPSARGSVEHRQKEWSVFVVASDMANAYTTFGTCLGCS